MNLTTISLIASYYYFIFQKTKSTLIARKNVNPIVKNSITKNTVVKLFNKNSSMMFVEENKMMMKKIKSFYLFIYIIYTEQDGSIIEFLEK